MMAVLGFSLFMHSESNLVNCLPRIYLQIVATITPYLIKGGKAKPWAKGLFYIWVRLRLCLHIYLLHGP